MEIIERIHGILTADATHYIALAVMIVLIGLYANERLNDD